MADIHNDTKITLRKGDITKDSLGAIVNAAHEGLTGGGGVDGAIHRAAGQKLLGECLNLKHCPTGEARITGGYDLPALYVIHTVGPVWRQANDNKTAVRLLKSCYWKSLAMATMQGLESIAFPNISTGAYCFPKDRASQIAIKTVQRFIEDRKTSLKEIRFVCFDDENFNLYLKQLGDDAVIKLDQDEEGDDGSEWDNFVDEEDESPMALASLNDLLSIKEAEEVAEEAAKAEEDKKKEIDQEALKEAIKEANEKYRLTGDDSGLTDEEYDYLQELCKDDEFTSKVGVEITDKNKVDLDVSMGSMTKVKTKEELVRWAKGKDIPTDINFAITPKFDGLALLVKYKNGNFVSATTRGDGAAGQNVTEHFRYTRLGKNRLPSDFTGHLIGEAIIPDEVFESKYKGDPKKEKGKYKMARSMVSGLLGKEEIQEGLKEVHFIAYGVEGKEFLRKTDLIKFCNDHNNFIFNYKIPLMTCTIDEVTQEDLMHIFEGIEIYSCDGLIVEVNNMAVQEEVGNDTNSLNPAYARAWKPEKEDARQTFYLGETWNVSKIGAVKPIVQIDPVEIGGSTIRNVTGINAKFMKENRIGPGAVLSIVKAGDVIPKISKVLLGSRQYQLIENCPCCGSKLHWNETEVDLMCPNEHCDDRLISQNVDFMKKMKVEEVGEGVIKQLYQEGVTTLEQILSMSIDDFEALEGFQRRKAEICYNEIHSKMSNVPLEQVQHASNLFAGLGSTKLALLKTYDSVDNTPSLRTITAIDGFSEKSAWAYLEGINKFWLWLEKLPITIEKYEPPKSGPLTGKMFVFTGGKPKDLIAKLEGLGGKVGSSVSKKSFALVLKQTGSGSSKEKKAADLGLKTFDWETLGEYLDGLGE
jgi:NAD-dependent DNA ligase/O-acetyl-ADP-ribose deacetylase (regulator of RNase III)